MKLPSIIVITKQEYAAPVFGYYDFMLHEQGVLNMAQMIHGHSQKQQ